MNQNLTERINTRIDQISSLPVLSGYYLVIGGGKIGNKFLEYAKRHNLPFVLVIDVDCEAPASRNAKSLLDRDSLIETISSLSACITGANTQEQAIRKETHGAEVYFYCMAAKEIPSLLIHGIPEYIVPAIPSHAAVDIVVDFLHFDQSTDLISALSISEEDRASMDYFESLVSHFPESIIAGKFPEHGAIFFSYARPGDICPDNCKGQEGYCYTFKRVKPKTITIYVRDLAGEQAGWVFESCQMGPGIGGIRGEDLKKNLLSVMVHVEQVKRESLGYTTMKSFFFVATTCNCHGILNILQIE